MSEEENYRKEMETWFASVLDTDRRQKLINIQVSARFSKPINENIMQSLQELASNDYC